MLVSPHGDPSSTSEHPEGLCGHFISLSLTFFLSLTISPSSFYLSKALLKALLALPWGVSQQVCPDGLGWGGGP